MGNVNAIEFYKKNAELFANSKTAFTFAPRLRENVLSNNNQAAVITTKNGVNSWTEKKNNFFQNKFGDVKYNNIYLRPAFERNVLYKKTKAEIIEA